MNLAEAFARAANQHKDKTAVFWGENEFTYHELLGRAERVATHLTAERKVQSGDRVGIWLKNCPEFIPAFFGVLNAGAVVVPINNFLKPEEVAHIVADAGIRVLI